MKLRTNLCVVVFAFILALGQSNARDEGELRELKAPHAAKAPVAKATKSPKAPTSKAAKSPKGDRELKAAKAPVAKAAKSPTSKAAKAPKEVR